jgi:hypothetical protein
MFVVPHDFFQFHGAIHREVEVRHLIDKTALIGWDYGQQASNRSLPKSEIHC